MTINGDDLLGSILASLERIQYIEPEDIPGIDLYMDQVTSFMDKRLRSTVRNPGDDRILTKTMINNYAKNDLIPPPVKKKYTKEHILLLIFIYYYKGILSINDIQKLLEPVTKEYFQCGEEFNLESVYREVLRLEKGQLEGLKEDVIKKYKEAEQTYGDAPKEGKDFLQKFAFICMLSYDVYVKKLMIEKMIDEMMSQKKE
ncbi:MAG: DUF1836 domain-containing protein [Lachnospiraceae bacterium]|nr:DUF1836 domain-containing protein [Lachnospiraceae bacterium]MBR3508897.1 DUF1836 domain-containing protein [Lachnospiraceae bacterium]MBR6151792.1 DUF1836 domain-containing protein [Lachnospiraceae bacterium]